MSRIERIEERTHMASSYSAAVRWDDLIVVSGRLGAEPGGAAVPFDEQAERALNAMLEAVEEAGGSAATLLKVSGYLADIADFEVYDRTYRRLLDPEALPCRTTVQIGAFIPPVLVEVDALAVREAARP
jgi:2-iminobutanoate/2-iminopropanoate deaminase